MYTVSWTNADYQSFRISTDQYQLWAVAMTELGNRYTITDVDGKIVACG